MFFIICYTKYMWNIKNIAKKYEERYYSAFAILVIGALCLFFSLIMAIDLFIQLWQVYYFNFGFSLILSILGFYLIYQTVNLISYIILDWFAKSSERAHRRK
jgi:uncharacterized protein (DUF983 family)